MEITTEHVAPREVEFTVHPPADQVAAAKRKAAQRISQRVRIPGFRPGKAPYALVERTVGKDLLTEEAAEIIGPDIYKQIMEEGNYRPLDRPTLTITQQEPLEFKIRVPLEPLVELGDYRSIRVEPEPEPEVTPEQEESLLQEALRQHATWEPVQRSAQLGDQVTLDLKGRADGEVVFDETGTEIVLEETLSPPGLSGAIIGMAPADVRQFTLTYPAQHSQESLAGKTVEFEATLRGVKENRLPEADDEFARSVGEYASLEELRDRLRGGLKAQLEADSRERLTVTVLDQLVAQSKIEYPNAAVEREVDRAIERQESRLRRSGFTLEGYLRAVHKSLPQMRDELRPDAEENLHRSLVLREVAKAEMIQIGPAEIMAEIEHLSSAYGERADAVRAALTQDSAMSELVGEVYTRRTMNLLIDLATGKAVPEVSPEVMVAEAEAGDTPAPAEPASQALAAETPSAGIAEQAPLDASAE